MVAHGENLAALVDISQSHSLCNLRRKLGVEAKSANGHCNYLFKKLQTGGAVSARSVKNRRSCMATFTTSMPSSSLAVIFISGVLAGIVGVLLLQNQIGSNTGALCELRGEKNFALRKWTSGRKNETGEDMDMVPLTAEDLDTVPLTVEDLDSYQDEYDPVATHVAEAEGRNANSSIGVKSTKRVDKARMLMSESTHTVRIEKGLFKSHDDDFMRQFREKVDKRPMYEVFANHPKFKNKFSKQELFDARNAVQSLFLKPQKTSPRAFKLYEYYLDQLLYEKEQQKSRNPVQKRMRDQTLNAQCDSEKLYLDRSADPWKFSAYDEEYLKQKETYSCPVIVGNPQQNGTICGRPGIDAEWIQHYRRYWDQLFRNDPDKDGNIPSTPRSVVDLESVPIWENVVVGDRRSGIGGQEPWIASKSQWNRRKFGFRFLNSTESPECLVKTIDLALLFLGTGYFDYKQNYHHALSNAILPMFAALRDAGVISGNKKTQKIVLAYMTTSNYYEPQFPQWLLDYLDPLVDEIYMIHHLQYGECIKMNKVIFGNGAVELGASGPLWENMFNLDDAIKSLTKIPEFRSFYMNAFEIPEKPVRYESSGDILFVNRNKNLADPRGTRQLSDIENAIACARLGPLKDRIKVVDWGEYTVREQLELTYNAAAVISIHGAGLSNTLWMRPGSQIVELIPYKLCGCRYFQGTVFNSMALMNDVDYHIHCLHRENMIYMEGFEPSEEEEQAPCKYHHFPFLYAVNGVRLSTGEIEVLLGSSLRKSALVREAKAKILASG